jgi:hypothetical protein
MTLENTIHACMPLIDFAQMSASDFYDRVLPFQQLLPHKLDDLLR